MSIDALSPGGAIDRDDDDVFTRRRLDSTRRDERSEPGVESGETVHERWFIRHGRHVRDSAVGQCVIRRDASGRIARVSIRMRFDAFDAFVRSFVRRVDVGARDRS